MKRHIIGMAVAVLFTVIACTSKALHSNNGNNSKSDKILSDTLMYLKNRIPNCDSALAFMLQVIVPVESEPLIDNKLIIERLSTVKIPGEGFAALQQDEKYKFYINPDCFIGKSSDIIIELFCIQETIASFKAIDKSFQERGKYWVLSVGGLGNQLHIRFASGKVVQVGYSKNFSSH